MHPPLQSRRNVQGREPWLLIFNCQADGLANSLGLLDPGIEVTHFDPERFAVHRDAVMNQLDRYERILVAPFMERQFNLNFGTRDNVWRVPHLLFFGYHPDLCHISLAGDFFRGPLGHFHSTLAYAAFRNGIDETSAAKLFREEVFAALGYFNAWDAERETLLQAFRHSGFALEDAFARWSSAGPFMHTPNHPKIECLHDIAKIILLRAGREIVQSGIVPHDNLTGGPVFPVYPEIGTRLGVVGNYQFKPGGGYRLMDLENYLAACFRIYREHPAERPSIPGFREQIERAITTLAPFCA